MANWKKIARRTFLIGAVAAAGGVAVGYWYVRKPYPNPLEGDLAEGEQTFNPYVKIAPDNTITVIAPRAEMGQGVSTTLAAFVAEE
ncbi:xanthine dehydrogenase family protein molybdopterin-binding subunit, partial [Salmonella enterica subsp. enterica serovar Typhi]|nr:xanthine dehydrogenase family protein molybdopterin-binding subunit [Salmonella enterica subsp. enterica serovar Typhi]